MNQGEISSDSFKDFLNILIALSGVAYFDSIKFVSKLHGSELSMSLMLVAILSMKCERFSELGVFRSESDTMTGSPRNRNLSLIVPNDIFDMTSIWSKNKISM